MWQASGMAPQRQRRQRSPLQEELLSLLDHEQGVYGEADLDLSLLRRHPAILMRQRAKGVKPFQEALVRLLKETVVLFRQPIEEALCIHFAFTQRSRDWSLQQRRDKAAEAAGKESYGAYSKDRGSKKSLLSVTLDRLEERISELATVEPALLPGERPSFGRLPNGPHRVSVARGRVVIDDLILLAACDRQQSAHQELLLEFETDLRADRPDPDEWPLLQAQLLPLLITEATADGREFKNELALDLTYIQPQSSAPGDPRRYKAGVSKTSYHRWAVMANCLDRDLSGLPEIAEQLGAPTLRESWQCHPTSLEELARQPAPALMGICVVVVAEEQIVVLERQGIHYVATRSEHDDKRRLAHFMGEGMTPADIDPVTGRYSPEQCALRGCEEELGLSANDIELIPTAVVLDTKRSQPLFCFLGRCELEIGDLEERMQFAPDRRETVSRIVAQVENSSRDDSTRFLLTGEHPEFVLASNHAEAALLHALFYIEGRAYVRDQLIKTELRGS
jgi:hypothetical protein